MVLLPMYVYKILDSLVALVYNSIVDVMIFLKSALFPQVSVPSLHLFSADYTNLTLFDTI